jgi:hypothetical protein
MQTPTVTTWSLKRLHQHLLGRRFAIPKLQRNFVWDAARAAKLLDSVYRDMPIGSLFLWEMERKASHLIRTSGKVLPPYDMSQRHVWFVIDGQQRLSVLYQAFKGEQRKNDRGRDIDFSRLCFVLFPDGEEQPRFVYRKPVDGELVPVQYILDAHWAKHVANLPARAYRAVKECRSRLLEYPVPVISVRGATLEEIGEIFVRVNSQGMTVTSADRAVALMGNVDVRSMATDLRDELTAGGLELPSIDALLMGFNLVTEKQQRGGDPPKLEAMARRWSRDLKKGESAKRSFQKAWDRYKKGVLGAADYLRQAFPVRDESYLPSANMLATLAVFFFHHPRRPSRLQAGEIRKWFWATGVGQRYSGRGYHENLVGDALFFTSLAEGRRSRFTFKERLDPTLDLQTAQYSSRSARTRAFFCLLASLNPRYLEDGEPVPLDDRVFSHANRKHRHHIFPRAHLRKHMLPRAYNSLVNICYLVAHDNQSIGHKLPRKYLSAYQQAGRRRFTHVMRSHLIPVHDDSGAWDRSVRRGFKQFRAARLEMICRAFENAAGLKLFGQPS